MLAVYLWMTLASPASTFMQAPTAAPPDPLILWSSATGEILMSSATAPIHASYGTRPVNVSGQLIKPSADQLCRGQSAAWQNRLILADDWIAPGCSMEQRTKNLEAAGARAVIFKGTEGVVFDWDGSDVSNLEIAVVILGYGSYANVAAAIDSYTSSATSTPAIVNVWLQLADSPLIGNPIFRGVDQTMQVLFFLAAGCTTVFALVQLYKFRTRNGPMAAQRVIFLEVLSLLAMLVFLVDGPCQEHTRPVLMPLAYDIMSQRLQIDLHILASLVFASHLRLIRSKIEGPALSDSTRRSSVRPSAWRRFSTKERTSSVPEVDEQRHPSRAPLIPPAVFSRGFIVMGLVMVAADLTLGAFTSCYLAASPFDLLAYVYLSLVMLIIGIWFSCQARAVMSGLKAAAASRNRDVGGGRQRLSRNALRVGASKISAIVLGTGGEFLRQELLMQGGWLYWGTMLPIWYLLQAAILASSFFQILAFQPPSLKVERRASARRSAAADANRSTKSVNVTAGSTSSTTSTCTLAGGFDLESSIRRQLGSSIASSTDLRGSNMSSMHDAQAVMG